MIVLEPKKRTDEEKRLLLRNRLLDKHKKFGILEL